MTTKDQINAAFQVSTAIGQAIRELGSVPSGKLYAVLMGRMSLEEFEGAINLLERLAIVERTQNNFLRWIGN